MLEDYFQKQSEQLHVSLLCVSLDDFFCRPGISKFQNPAWKEQVNPSPDIPERDLGRN